MKRPNIQQAIRDITEDISIHRDWAEFIRHNPDEAAQPEPIAQTAGDVAHHEKWIEALSNVLACLKEHPDAVRERRDETEEREAA